MILEKVWIRKKITAAISAAVTAYIKTEEEALLRADGRRVPGSCRRNSRRHRLMNLWGISGRQAQMQMRNLMQMRLSDDKLFLIG